MKATARKKKLKRILLLFGHGHSSRAIIKGIMRYRRYRDHWTTDIRNTEDVDFKNLKLNPEHFDGAMIELVNPECRKLLRSLAIPAVLFHSDLSDLGLPKETLGCGVIFADNYTIINCAVQHLVGRGFSSFAYVGAADNPRWSQERAIAANHILSRLGYICRVYPKISAAMARNFTLEERKLGAWLKELPRKTAVIAANDIRAEQVLTVCRRCGLRVPGDLAVLGIDNDEELCDIAVPTLSSVALEWEDAGRRAAEALDRTMNAIDDGRAPDAPFSVPYASPLVVTRESTDEKLSRDTLVRRACAIIHSANGVGVSPRTLTKELRISERSLQIHFMASLGHTPSAEIARARIDYLKTLVSDLSLSRSVIAERCGFNTTSHLAYFFRLHTGTSIRQFRKKL